MPVDKNIYDTLIVEAADRYRNNPRILKSIVQVESYFNPRAYRYEPALFQRMKAKDPYWADKDPSIVSASYGLCQVLFSTAWAMERPADWNTMNHARFQQYAEGLYEPRVSLDLGSRLLRALLDKVWADKLPEKFEDLSAMSIVLARYNGGSYKNPDEDGVLDEQKYVDKVFRAFAEIKPLRRTI